MGEDIVSPRTESRHAMVLCISYSPEAELEEGVKNEEEAAE